MSKVDLDASFKANVAEEETIKLNVQLTFLFFLLKQNYNRVLD